METIIESIAMAFQDVPYPGDDHLTVYDSAGRDFDETWQLLRGKRWQDLPVAEFMRGDTPIPDLSPAAFHYYLPALLTAALDVDDDATVYDSLAFFLAPSSATNAQGPAYTHYDDRASFHQRMALFTPQQREVMVRALQLLANRWQDDGCVHEAIASLSSDTERGQSP